MKKATVLALLLAAFVLPSAAQGACRSEFPTVTKKNPVGIYTLYRLQLPVYWCAKGGNVYSVSVGNFFPLYTRAWVDLKAAAAPTSRYGLVKWSVDGKQHRYFYFVRTAHLTNCTPIITYCHHYYPSIKGSLLWDTDRNGVPNWIYGKDNG